MRTLKYSFLLTAILFSFLSAKGTIKISVINGNWYSASTWSPSGIPASIEDTIIINSNVTINVFTDITASVLWIYPSASLTSNSTLTLHGNLRNEGLLNISIIAVGDGINSNNTGTINGIKYVTGNNNYFNSGDIAIDSLTTNEVSFINSGSITSTFLSTSGGFNNSGTISASSNFMQLATFTNSTGGYISAPIDMNINEPLTNQAGALVIAGNVINSNNMINDGDFSCTDFMHTTGIISGTTGKFCIANCFQNVSAISGTIDICDASTGSPCDVNMGTIASGVTLCVASPCMTSAGVNENTDQMKIAISPNPANSFINIDLPELTTATLFILDVKGVLKYQSNINQGMYKIDLSGYKNGIYLMHVISNRESRTFKIVKISE